MAEHKFTDEEIIKALECCASADCVNCPRWSEEWYSGMCADFLPSVLDLIKRQKPKWISVSERLPKSQQMVIGYTPCDGYMFVGFYQKVDSSYGKSYWNVITAMRSTRKMTKKVTHWMPLPEPPKGVSNDS